MKTSASPEATSMGRSVRSSARTMRFWMAAVLAAAAIAPSACGVDRRGLALDDVGQDGSTSDGFFHRGDASSTNDLAAAGGAPAGSGGTGDGAGGTGSGGTTGSGGAPVGSGGTGSGGMIGSG